MPQPSEPMNADCGCRNAVHQPTFIVLTGGPGAGKTAVLELVRKIFCQHVAVLPEAASILFGGGFWRRDTVPARSAAQRAIYYVQKELETIVVGEKNAAIGLCDRGSIDGLAYWPKDEKSYWEELNTNRAAEYAKYAAVIHLRTPATEQGYNHVNPVRVESAIQAMQIDQKLLEVWQDHPKRIIVACEKDFLLKADKVIKEILAFVPKCCAMKKD